VIHCPQCSADNSDKSRFCRQCGARFAAACPSCGAVGEPGSRFCDACGSPLPATTLGGPGARALAPDQYTPRHLAERILTARPAAESERKQVTVLFADMKSSLELLADRGPEAARDLVDPVLECMMQAVHRYEGMVNQVLGDGIMALFGAPLSVEDHALRACYAALALQNDIARHAESVLRAQGVTIQVRVGLNSGEVLLRTIGNDLSLEYSAIGLTTHLAARMEQLAPPGHILMTTETFRLVEGYVSVASLGLVPVKGLPDPVVIYQLLGPGAARTRLQAVATRGLTRFVGRQREMEALTHALDAASRGRGQLVALVGEAGVGKSRLVRELTQSAATQGWRILESRSVSYGRAAPYGPVRDLLRSLFQISDSDDREATRQKVTTKVLTRGRLIEDTVPAILTLLDALPADSSFSTLDPRDRRQRTLEAVKGVLIRESQLEPLLIVTEDLHWIDSETQALLDSLVESLPPARIFLLVNYRPEYRHNWASKSCYAQIRVDPLIAEGADELLEALLGSDPGLDPLKRLLMEQTDGNPLFLEECIRTLAETHALDGRRGAYHLARPLGGITVPATVHAVLAARIDRLPAAEKALLQTASVIGKDVPFALLKAITELPEGELRAGLSALQTAEFIHEVSWFPELEYTFDHALTHEVTYSGLVKERRQASHARIVDALERLALGHPMERVERLAQHAVRGAVWSKATTYLRRTGANAVAQSAYPQAVTCFEQALEALGHLPQSVGTMTDEIDLRFDLRNALFALGRLEELFVHLNHANVVAETLGDERRLGWVAAYLSHYFWRVGDHPRSIETGQQGIAIGEALDDIGLQTTNVQLGLTYYTVGDYRRAVQCLRRIIGALGERFRSEQFGWAGVPAVISRAYLMGCLGEIGQFTEGIVLGEEAIRIAQEANHAFSLGQAYINLGVLYMRKGDVERAITHLERGKAMVGVSKVSALSIGFATALGYGYALSNRLPEAVPLLEDAVERAGANRIAGRYSLWMAWLAETYLSAGRVDDASRLADRALALSRDHGERGNEVHILFLLAEIGAVVRTTEDAKEVETAYRYVVGRAEELGMRPLVARCHLGLGRWYRSVGRLNDCRQLLRAAVDLFRDMQMQTWLERTEAELGEV
jgi:class 3 adenylate cyclase/tetratricopeptide (TPR) repeat protein